ncbi:MAG: GNAT family N-acetyltransferase [Alphaproteobacteria bacterium]|nr:GNAT family N-acetyltransferase [Alphaproteobacteria bacterium]
MSRPTLPGDVSLRRATPRDAGAISAIAIACWRDTYVGHLPDDLLAGLESGPWHSAAAWRAVLASDDDATVTEIVEIEDEPAGFVRSGPVDAPRGACRGIIQSIYLLRDYRAKGLGSALIDRARARLRDAVLTPVAIEAFVFNAPALALYRRLGARDIDRRTAFEHGGVVVEEIVLGWPEPPSGV